MARGKKKVIVETQTVEEVIKAEPKTKTENKSQPVKKSEKRRFKAQSLSDFLY